MSGDTPRILRAAACSGSPFASFSSAGSPAPEPASGPAPCVTQVDALVDSQAISSYAVADPSAPVQLGEIRADVTDLLISFSEGIEVRPDQ